MNIHEYQGKAVLKSFGAPVSKGHAAFTVKEAVEAAKMLPGPLWVVKSQIHAGGRGKGKFKEAAAGDKGGVRLAWSVEEVEQYAREMLGNTLVTQAVDKPCSAIPSVARSPEPPAPTITTSNS